ncbi:hypothetical protein [Muriicola sp. Z0-33]|uniref:hypothetical protein n=1 Tax=Muriicola sp. Z0-33 TaxID=2816957 RepID=UPI0022381E83|nr:hypothetical protein [Muriicola sp. Z0-33]MCW5516067.1 hypothetical protein [Muriicola sp. Z0-33]
MFTIPYRSLLGLLSICLFLSCSNTVNKEKEKEKIQEQIALISKAHFNKDATQFYAPYASSWYDAREGNISIRIKDSAKTSTQAYLDQMEILELKPTHDPVIEISDDGKMASYMGAVILKGRYNTQPSFWVVSWQSVLKKINDQWQIIGNANTQATPVSTANVILELAMNEVGYLNKESTIYALADCKSPGGSFKTLIISESSKARMEQKQGVYHAIFKHGPLSSWSRDVSSGKVNESIDGITDMFIKGHELHWLGFRPEDRFSNPSFKGFEEYDGQSAFRIQFTDALNRPVFFYYAFDNYMPLGFSIATDTENKRVKVYYRDWRALGELKVFYGATFVDGANIFDYEYTHLKISGEQDFDLDLKTAYLQ